MRTEESSWKLYSSRSDGLYAQDIHFRDAGLVVYALTDIVQTALLLLADLAAPPALTLRPLARRLPPFPFGLGPRGDWKPVPPVPPLASSSPLTSGLPSLLHPRQRRTRPRHVSPSLKPVALGVTIHCNTHPRVHPGPPPRRRRPSSAPAGPPWRRIVPGTSLSRFLGPNCLAHASGRTPAPTWAAWR